jgi:primosomal protein N' (replication factor Y)
MKGKRGFFSRELISYCKATLSRKKQIIILVNRKGYFTIEICKKCGYIQRCPNCNTVLVYHKDEGLVCHYCGYKAERIEVCPQCNGKMESFGYGTERIEDITHKLFPKARISRLDADLSEKEIDEIWKKFTEGHIDILVGTQMIARGFRLPNVYLAGILVPDTSLNIPDFRSSEKIFNLIYSLAEQAKDDKHVIIQTLNPDYYPIKYAVRLDYKDFYQYEVRLRRTLGYPPYSRIIRIIVSGLEEEGVKTIISSLAQDIERKLGISYSGPARAPLYKMRGRFYWHILLKIKDLNLDILKVVKEIINSYNYKGIDIMVDVDPVSTV